jgi:hypothetical protein
VEYVYQDCGLRGLNNLGGKYSNFPFVPYFNLAGSDQLISISIWRGSGILQPKWGLYCTGHSLRCWKSKVFCADAEGFVVAELVIFSGILFTLTLSLISVHQRLFCAKDWRNEQL